MHFSLFFFKLGIGIDDMFVIVQCLSNIEENDPTFNERPIEILIGETMAHAGVAITITSITDLCVFGVGAITVSLKEKKIVKSILTFFHFYFSDSSSPSVILFVLCCWSILGLYFASNHVYSIFSL